MKIKPAVLITVIASIIAIGAGLNLFWTNWGWKTPAGHEADLAAAEEKHIQEFQSISLQLKKNRDEWWCDEQDEYLDDLLRLKDGGSGSAALDQEVLEQRQKMEATECHRFDED